MLDEGIQPLERDSFTDSGALSNQIFNRIKEWLRTGKLKEGDPLPSERELAQTFDVSRVPVREALKVLEFVGIVQHVRGKGVFIRKVSANNIIETVDFVMMNPAYTIRELFEVRMGIETQAAFLAALLRTDEDLALMLSALEEAYRAPTSVEPFLGFHSAIIVASRNPALVEINKFLADWLRFLRAKYMYSPVGGEHGNAEHREIFELIKAGDSLGAMSRMQEHLMRARNMIEDVTASAKTEEKRTQGE